MTELDKYQQTDELFLNWLKISNVQIPVEKEQKTYFLEAMKKAHIAGFNSRLKQFKEVEKIIRNYPNVRPPWSNGTEWGNGYSCGINEACDFLLDFLEEE
jgi:hypothetical protein